MEQEEKRYNTTDATNQKIIIELLIIIVLAVAAFFVAARYDILEEVVTLSRSHEEWEIDEVFSVFIFLLFAVALFSIRRVLELKKSEGILLLLNKELQDALSEIKELRGIVPICSSCKKIRDDKGYWHQVESYLRARTDVEFSHGICPDCIKTLYRDYAAQVEEEESVQEASQSPHNNVHGR